MTTNLCGMASVFCIVSMSFARLALAFDTVTDVDAVVARTDASNDRKRQFTRRQIGLAVDVLAANEWIDPIRPGLHR